MRTVQQNELFFFRVIGRELWILGCIDEDKQLKGCPGM